jgi:hypothetical protein
MSPFALGPKSHVARVEPGIRGYLTVWDDEEDSESGQGT